MPPAELRRRARLFSALEALFDARFEEREHGRDDGLDAALVFDGILAEDARIPVLRFVLADERPPDAAASVVSLGLAEPLDVRLRGRRLSESGLAAIHARLSEGEPLAWDDVGSVWALDRRSGTETALVAPNELAPDEPLPEIPPPRIRADVDKARMALARLVRSLPVKPVLGLCPGAEYGPAKRWPAEYYADVAKAKLDEGWEVWLFGSENDAPVSGAIQSLTGNRCLDLSGKTTLSEAIDLMSLTTAVVTNDSGLMHVAAALGRALIAIYGSTDPGHTPPMSEEASILYLSVECSPCFERECPFGHYRCLRDIMPDTVLHTLRRLAGPTGTSVEIRP